MLSDGAIAAVQSSCLRQLPHHQHRGVSTVVAVPDGAGGGRSWEGGRGGRYRGGVGGGMGEGGKVQVNHCSALALVDLSA